MPPQRREDRFANLASAEVTESAAGVMTFAELLTGISIGAGIGILFDKISYQLNISSIADILASGDAIQCGWFTSSDAVAFNYNDRRLIDSMILQTPPVIGAVASSGQPVLMPVIHDFSPPLIIASPRIFLGALGVSLGNPVNVISRLYFRYQPLTPVEYLELAEAFVHILQ